MTVPKSMCNSPLKTKHPAGLYVKRSKEMEYSLPGLTSEENPELLASWARTT